MLQPAQVEPSKKVRFLRIATPIIGGISFVGLMPETIIGLIMAGMKLKNPNGWLPPMTIEQLGKGFSVGSLAFTLALAAAANSAERYLTFNEINSDIGARLGDERYAALGISLINEQYANRALFWTNISFNFIAFLLDLAYFACSVAALPISSHMDSSGEVPVNDVLTAASLEAAGRISALIAIFILAGTGIGITLGQYCLHEKRVNIENRYRFFGMNLSSIFDNLLPENYEYNFTVPVVNNGP